MLGNAYVGSIECLKEFQWGESQKYKFVPVFLEPFVSSEAEFAEKNTAAFCDGDRKTFGEWEKWADVVKRLSFSKQGCVALLTRKDFLCPQCERTVRHDKVCATCSDWKGVMRTSVRALRGV